MSTPGQAVLPFRVAQTTADLTRIEKLLAASAVVNATDQAVRDRFQLLASGAARDLVSIGKLAARDGASPGLWKRMADTAEDVKVISREALAYVQGILLRVSGLDEGVGAVAERLLAGLIGRTGVDRSVLLAVDDRELFDHTVSMVRLRFPDTSVWGLPILAHELGHHVAVTLADVDPASRGTQPVLRHLSDEARDEARSTDADQAQVRRWLPSCSRTSTRRTRLARATRSRCLCCGRSPTSMRTRPTPTHPGVAGSSPFWARWRRWRPWPGIPLVPWRCDSRLGRGCCPCGGS